MGCSGLKVTESCWFSVVCAINVTAIFRHLNRVFRILNYCLCLHSYQYLNLTKTLPKKDKTIIFEQGWRRLHMYLLHFQSSTLTSLIGGWMQMPSASPNTNFTWSTQITLQPVTEGSPARLLIPLAFCALLSETGSCRQSTEHAWPASCRLTHCHTNSLLKFITSQRHHQQHQSTTSWLTELGFLKDSEIHL